MQYILDYINETELSDFKQISEKDYLRRTPLSVSRLRNGIVLPVLSTESGSKGGVLDQDGHFEPLSRDDLQTEIIEEGYEVVGEIPYENKTVLYLGLYKRHWGYYITNIVTRLWYLLQIQESSQICIAYTVPQGSNWGQNIDGNFLEFFDILGIREEQLLRVDRPTRFAEVIVCEHAYVPGEYYTAEFKQFYDHLRDQVTLQQPSYEKVYFTRVGNRKADARDYGEHQFIEIFRRAGYHIVEPEGKTLREQIWLLKNSKTIACVSGTLLHNLLFASDGAEVISLNRQAMPMLSHLYQGGINQMRDVTITNIDAALRILPVNGAGPNIFYLSDLLCRFLTDNGFTYERPDYRRHSLKNHLILIWYFFKWLDFYNRDNPMNLDRITGQLDRRSVNVYAHYRQEIGQWYDLEESRKQRDLFYQFIHSL